MTIPGLPAHALAIHLVDLDQPWRASPPPDVPPGLGSQFPDLGRDGPSGSHNTAPQRAQDRRQSKRIRRFAHSFKELFDTSNPHRFRRSARGAVTKASSHRQIKPEDWRAYGYWARPYINGVGIVDNDTPKIVPGDINPQDVFRSLLGPRGSPHPERWVPRMQHPSLPPRPEGFQTPNPYSPIPPPSELQLNPYLAHRTVGMPSIIFDVGLEPGAITFAETAGLIPLLPGDLVQPATWPLVVQMDISAVADDNASPWRWPVRVYNSRGVKVVDVFECIYQNFQEHMTQEEYDSLSEKKRGLVSRAYWTRCQPDPPNMYPPPDRNDGIRRIDYMLDRTLFRGLEPHPHQDGDWIMFIGNH